MLAIFRHWEGLRRTFFFGFFQVFFAKLGMLFYKKRNEGKEVYGS